MKTLTLATVIVAGCLLLNCADAPANNATPLAATGVAPGAAATANSRFFLILLDSSTSYKDYGAALQGLNAALNHLRPGDRFALARINEKVEPKNFIILKTDSGQLAADLLVPPKTVTEWKEKNERLAQAWRPIDGQRPIIAAALQKLRGANTAKLTDFHEALRYAVRFLNDQPQDEKVLLVCSDLEHDTGKPTFKPPATPLAVAQLHVRLLFVPGNTQRIRRAGGCG